MHNCIKSCNFRNASIYIKVYVLYEISCEQYTFKLFKWCLMLHECGCIVALKDLFCPFSEVIELKLMGEQWKSQLSNKDFKKPSLVFEDLPEGLGQLKYMLHNWLDFKSSVAWLSWKICPHRLYFPGE